MPVDFSPHSLAALEMAMLIVPGADIMVLHAFDPPFEGKLWLAGMAQEDIRRYTAHVRHQALTDINALISEGGSNAVRVHSMVEHGTAAPVIIAKEVEIEADLTVIGKHGQSIIEELFLGKVSATFSPIPGATCL